MFYSALEMFRAGPGPSSSRMVAPHRASERFVHALAADGRFEQTARIEVQLMGALAFTGRDLGVHRAVVAGLSGEPADRCDATSMAAHFARADAEGRIQLGGRHSVAFDPRRDIRFNISQTLASHSSALRIDAFDAAGERVASQIYVCSAGGEAFDADAAPAVRNGLPVPYVFSSAAELLALARLHNKKLTDIARGNECAQRSPLEVRNGLLQIAREMRGCIERGLGTEGSLPGTNAVRRAPAQGAGRREGVPAAQLCAIYATAVAEENAAGGRVVGAPTNGSAGPVAALLECLRAGTHLQGDDRIADFLLAAALVGGVLRNAGLRQAGCQSTVGVASAMAAAGYTAASSGTNAQVLFAAERALERHFNLACDSIEGRVQQPCIERNAAGATYAYAAAQEATRLPDPRPDLDRLAATMVDAGRRMANRYKTASLAGVAVNIADC